WLWFGEIGQQRVWWTILGARAQLAVLFGLAFFLLTFVNVWLARRGSTPLTPRYEDFPLRVQMGRLARAGLSLLLLLGSLAAGLLALNLLTFLAVVVALGFLANAVLRLLWLPVVALGLLVASSVLLGGIYPGFVQRFTVQPNELVMERPYIQRHLEFTRAAYG